MTDVYSEPAITTLSGAGPPFELVSGGIAQLYATATGVNSFSTATGSVASTKITCSGAVGYVNTNFCWCEPGSVVTSGRGSVLEGSGWGGAGYVVLQGAPTLINAAFSPATGAAYLSAWAFSDTPYCNPIHLFPEPARVFFDIYPNIRVVSSIRNPVITLVGGMMSAKTYVYNKFLELMSENEIDFNWHDIYGLLMTTLYTPDIDYDEYLADVSMFELPPTSVYSAGGVKLTDPVYVRNDTTDTVSLTWNPLRWNVPEGESLSGMKGLLLVDKSIAQSPLLAFLEFADPMTVPQMNSFVVTPVITFLNSGG